MARAIDHTHIELRARRIRRGLLAACMLLAPTLLTVGVAIEPSVDWERAASVVGAAVDNPMLWQVQALLAMAGFMLLVPAAIAIGELIRPNRPGMALAGVSVFGVGAVLLGAGFIQRWALAGAEGLDPQVMATYWEQATELSSGVFLFPFIFFLPVGMILLGVGLWRSRSVPLWAAILAPAAFVVLFFVPAGALAVVAGVVTVVAFSALTWAYVNNKVAEIPPAREEAGRPRARLTATGS